MNKIMIEVPNDSAELRKNAFMLGLMADAMDKAAEKWSEDNATPIDDIEKHVDQESDDPNIIDTSDIESKIPASEGGTGVELDKEGLPWDVRIHSANKSRLAKTDCWKKKRGVDDTLVTSVEAELRATMAATGEPHVIDDLIEETTAAVAPAPPATEEVIAPAPPAAVLTMEETTFRCTDGSTHLGSVLLGSGWTKEQILALEVIGAGSEAPAAPVTAVTFPELMTLITPALAAKTIAESDVLKAVNDSGLTSLALLAARPDLVGQVKTALFG